MAGLQTDRAKPATDQGERCLPASAVAMAGGRGGAVGETLLGLTSVLPTNVTPSSITSLEERISPNSSVLALSSILSFAVTLPVTLPRTTTVLALMLPLITALSPRVKVPSDVISPSSLPSNVSSPANFTFPLISTSEFKTFLALPDVVIGCSIRLVTTLPG